MELQYLVHIREIHTDATVRGREISFEAGPSRKGNYYRVVHPLPPRTNQLENSYERGGSLLMGTLYLWQILTISAVCWVLCGYTTATGRLSTFEVDHDEYPWTSKTS